MDDEKIVELYFSRSEEAIEQTQKKYGHYCRAIAFRILRSVSEAEECEDDAYMRAWDSIPPERPRRLSAFLGRITRNLALDRYDRSRAAKRWSALSVAIDELGDVIPDTVGGAEICDSLSLREADYHKAGNRSSTPPYPARTTASLHRRTSLVNKIVAYSAEFP